MKNNPYTLMFGKKPSEFITRVTQTSSVIEAFSSDNPSQQVYIITGVRGSGKTVCMSDIVRQLNEDKNWVTVELTPEEDMLSVLAGTLASNSTLSGFFKSAKINLSFLGFGVEMKNETPVLNIQTALKKMLESMKKHGKRLLITVDEAVSTSKMKEFISVFQILARQDLPVFLLMTGLYENIYNLQNEKTMTFLYRAPKIVLGPLNIGFIAANYQKHFHLSDEKALEMARMTKGYSFAFQVLGYFTYENGELNDEVMMQYEEYLNEYVYEKVWSELSRTDKKVVYEIARSATGRILDIRKQLNMNTNQFTVYRTRLIRKGIISGQEHGYVSFTLPLFEKYAVANYGIF